MQSNHHPLYNPFIEYLLFLEKSFIQNNTEEDDRDTNVGEIEDEDSAEDLLGTIEKPQLSFDDQIKDRLDQVDAKLKTILNDAVATEDKKNAAKAHLTYLEYLTPPEFKIKKTKPKENIFLRMLKIMVLIPKELIPAIAGATDDLATAMKKVLGDIAPIVLGGAGALSHLLEGREALLDIRKTLQKRKKADNEKELQKNNDIIKKHQVVQFRTRIAAHTARLGIAGAGVGTSAAYIAFAVGASVLGGPIMPVIIFGLITVAAAFHLWTHASILHQAKKDEASAKIARDDALKSFDENKINKDDPNFAEEIKIIASKESAYQACMQKRSKAENKVAFSTLELVVTAVVLASTIMGVAAILGAATVASFGAAPLAIGAAAAGVAIAIKLYRLGDKHFHWTERMKAACKNKWHAWFSPKSKATITPTPINRSTTADLQTSFIGTSQQFSQVAQTPDVSPKSRLPSTAPRIISTDEETLNEKDEETLNEKLEADDALITNSCARSQ